MVKIEKLKQRLKRCKKEEIIITEHAEIQAIVRDISLDEVKGNIVQPDKLFTTK